MIERLTPREVEVITLVCKGYDDEQIMKECKISLGTLHTHMTNLYQKFFISDGTRKGAKTKRLRLALAYIKEHMEVLND